MRADGATQNNYQGQRDDLAELKGLALKRRVTVNDLILGRSAANQLPYLMTVAEFLDWETPDGSDRWELIDGTPEAMTPASDRHGPIESGTRPNEHNVRVPDLSITCGPLDPCRTVRP